MDININISRERSVFSSKNSSRKLSIYLNASSISYYKKIKIWSNNHLWSEQIKIKEIALLYISNTKEENIPVKQMNDNSHKERAQYVNIKISAINNIPTSQDESILCKSSTMFYCHIILTNQLNPMLRIVKHTQFLFLTQWNFWKLILKIW